MVKMQCRALPVLLYRMECKIQGKTYKLYILYMCCCVTFNINERTVCVSKYTLRTLVLL